MTKIWLWPVCQWDQPVPERTCSSAQLCKTTTLNLNLVRDATKKAPLLASSTDFHNHVWHYQLPQLSACAIDTRPGRLQAKSRPIPSFSHSISRQHLQSPSTGRAKLVHLHQKQRDPPSHCATSSVLNPSRHPQSPLLPAPLYSLHHRLPFTRRTSCARLLPDMR